MDLLNVPAKSPTILTQVITIGFSKSISTVARFMEVHELSSASVRTFPKPFALKPELTGKSGGNKRLFFFI